MNVRKEAVSVGVSMLVLTIGLSGCLDGFDASLENDGEQNSLGRHERDYMVKIGGGAEGSCQVLDSSVEADGMDASVYLCIRGTLVVSDYKCDPPQMWIPTADDYFQDKVEFEDIETAEAAQEGVEGPGDHYLHCEGRFVWFIEGQSLVEGARMEVEFDLEEDRERYECPIPVNSRCRVEDEFDQAFTFYGPDENQTIDIEARAIIYWPTEALHMYYQTRMTFEWPVSVET